MLLGRFGPPHDMIITLDLQITHSEEIKEEINLVEAETALYKRELEMVKLITSTHRGKSSRGKKQPKT